ncbi:sodium/proton-potassium antiporter GerN (CPA2 family) [Methanohalophilus euhalobius]|uniref:Sodium/proton-potassium antiporter GerN (CPA2 family) n=1 Tax=Methanohalophilus euhalobius TaxID=51203 RepID=A0A285GBB3_9EURY|nr:MULTISPECIES: cation:proton antiporter [Methanohalophilus]ODV50198.1 MAG: sodium/proton-potassium antiporter GerN, CPA2 family [Methanohalophilus sp. 2-GBenrich]RSD36226.1 MAG: sodium/proton-potassium antiporter GerN, CPA2 family [Methanohalophilus sp.]TCL12106.1 sodium/proton-potassium antiporter GerN (CPA2 family) [Methanohalophilus euhalobius]SNY20870.1 sodium/proton-potassium antiporter GerN, CPA2 family [Methanohalophilus euhalobius]
MEFLFQILIILLSARVLSEVSERAGMPGILGEILAGIFLGMTVLENTDTISSVAELGVIFLLFIAGYKEVHIEDLKASSKKAIVATVFQILIAFISGFGLGYLFGLGNLESLVLAVAFSPTSIGVTVKTLLDMNYLSSKAGSMMLSSAIFDDIISIFLVSIVSTMAQHNAIPSSMQFLTMIGKLVVFIGVMFLLSHYVFSRLFGYVRKMHSRESIFATVILIALFAAYFAEAMGLHAVIGAFVGGVLLSNISVAKIEDVQSKVSGLAYGMLTPVFFVDIGMSVDPTSLGAAGIFTVLIVVFGLLGKLVGGFVGAKTVGFNFYESLIFGAGVMPRAEVTLVTISIGREMGIIGEEIFSAVVLLAAVSIFVAPILLKFAIQKDKENKNSASG